VIAADVTDVVVSLSGRDRGKYFLVVAVEGEYLFLSDGASRRVEKPKRKKRKHTQFLAHSSAAKRLQEDGKRLSNSEIRRALAECGAVDYFDRGRN
jgi:ribosomal protein L14E/L6E/L27E